MELIDTHCHLYCEEFDNDRREVISRARETGITSILLPAIDSLSTERQQQLYSSDPSYFKQMGGVHPTSINDEYTKELQHAKQLLYNNPEQYVAIGEIGLDLYWDTTFKEQQIQALDQQLNWAEELHKPVCIHIRKAHNELFELLKKRNSRTCTGVLHCYSGSHQQAHQAIEMGFHLGIGGVLTYKNAATLPEIVKDLPLECFLLETDAPYLSPVPYRGKRNESSYMLEVAKKIAEIKNCAVSAVAEQTTHNAKSLFNL